MTPHVLVRGLPAARVPVLVHVPHAGIEIPEHVRQGLSLSDAALRAELVCMTDWHTDELFSPVLDLGGVLFTNRLSRLVVDPERFAQEDAEPMEAVGMGAVYTRTSGGGPLRTDLSVAERERLLERYFRPYALAFEEVVAGLLDRFGWCLVVDAHSYPSRPLPYERNPDAPRPEICLGTDAIHSPEALIRALKGACGAWGVTTARDTPFAGTYVPLRFLNRDPRVGSVMLEVRRDLYCDESTGARHAGFSTVMGRVGDLLRVAAVACLARHS